MYPFSLKENIIFILFILFYILYGIFSYHEVAHPTPDVGIKCYLERKTGDDRWICIRWF